jgi:hypothetical protein
MSLSARGERVLRVTGKSYATQQRDTQTIGTGLDLKMAAFWAVAPCNMMYTH